MANSWMKLYYEILSDPKMGRMSDKLFRRTIELFLIAGKEDQGGELPDIEDIAWSLHISKKEVQTTIKELISLNIITVQSEKYVITHFAERQKSDMTRSEINRNYYEKKKLKTSEIQTENKTEIQTEKFENSDNSESEIQTENKTVDKELRIKNKNKNINSLSNDRECTRARNPESEKSEISEKPKPQKHKHGSFANVLLTDKELDSLHERFLDADDRIENFSRKKAAKGYSYKSDYAAILSWAESDAKRDAEKAKNQPSGKQQRESWDDACAKVEAELAGGDPFGLMMLENPGGEVIDL